MPVKKMIYMYVTHLLWGSIFITSINIPYGSMASAVTSDPDQRTSLSTFPWYRRDAGRPGHRVGAPSSYLYDGCCGKSDRKRSAFYSSGRPVFLLAIVCYFICYRCTTERVRMDRMGNRENATLAKNLP